MCLFKKKKQKVEIDEPKKLSEEAVDYIKKYAIKDLGITKPIDEDVFLEIFDMAESDELHMIDEEGYDRKDLSSEEYLRCVAGMEFVTECCQITIDYDDLNRRLGLK